MSKTWVLTSLTVMLGIVGGLGSAGLIAMIHSSVTLQDQPTYLPWLFVGGVLLVISARISAAWVVTYLAQQLIYELRLDLSRKILAAPLSRLQSLGAPRLLANLTEDIAALAVVMQIVPRLCVGGAIVLGCLAYMGFLAWPLLLLVIAAIILGTTVFLLIKSRAMGALWSARTSEDKVFVHFRGLTEGIKELKLNRARREAFFFQGLGTSADACRRYSATGQGLYILAGNIAQSLLFVVIGVILFGLPAFLSFSNSTLSGFVLALVYLMAPLAGLVDALPALGRARVALERIQSLGRSLEASAESISCYRRPQSLLFPGDLELIGVIHCYYRDDGERPFTLGPVNLRIQGGEIVFLVGGNGSGKSTLALLLVGLYPPEQGEIRLGEQRIAESNREDYRQHFSAVFSDFYLFDSLLGFQGRERDAEARAYLTHLQLDHKVRIENGTFSTLDLSQGQRKRLALLVAYLEDRPFYVFDEWAADQDPVFKKIFYTEILPALKEKGKAVVVITHDDHYFYVADRCLKLEEGMLSELPIIQGQQAVEPGSYKGDDWKKTMGRRRHETSA